MRSFCVIPPTKRKVVQHLVRICDTLTSDYYGALPLSRKRCGKTREMPGFSVNPDFFTKVIKGVILMQKFTNPPVFFAVIILCFVFALPVQSQDLSSLAAGNWKEVAPGVWRATFGAKDNVSLLSMAGFDPKSDALNEMGTETFPFARNGIVGSVTDGRTVIRLPFGENERLYGFGLQFKTVDQGGKVRHLHVDHYGGRDDGRTHAPVPFYVSSRGYGVLFDAAEYISVYTGIANRKDDPNHPEAKDRNTDKTWSALPNSHVVEVAVPAGGVDVLVFAGPSPLEAVRRFNLYCGGGCLPPLWGLGFWHRTPTLFSDDDVINEAEQFKERGYPLSVIGLEPGWQSRSYPCTYEWDSGRFPDPAAFMGKMKERNIRVNLWENPYISPDAELYDKVLPYSGSHTVWCGIVPDYTLPEVCELVTGQHKRNHLDIGVSGYKIDEVDGFDQWLWPDHATFPSGIDGDSMRQIYALRLQKTFTDMFRERNTRTYGLVRASNAGGVSFPFVIYNDYYSHRDFITALINSGFSGILWVPEVRASESGEEWLRRMQTVCFSPMAMINAWADGTKPWSFPEVADEVCETMNMRMRFIPYLYSAFARYHFDGTPPFRSMHLERDFASGAGVSSGGQLDSTDNPYAVAVAHEIKDQYMMGDNLLVAPLFAGETGRKVVLPRGKWYDFYTGTYAGSGEIITVSPGLDTIPLYVRDGGIIPMMQGTDIPGENETMNLEIRHYGTLEGLFKLYEDDGVTFDYERGEFCWRELKVTRSSDGSPKGTMSKGKDGVPKLYGDVTWRFMSE